jgi:two-component system, chemotaxis family, sensor kinase Cph1
LLSETLQKLDRAITPCSPPPAAAVPVDPNQTDLSSMLEECFELISDLEENSSTAVTTLNDLINYDKIETKSFSIEKKDVDIWTVFEKTIKPLVNQAREKNIRMELVSQVSNPSAFPSGVDLPLRNLRLVGDAIKLGQVVRNLVSNALKFTPADGEVKIAGTHSSSFSLPS